MKTTSFLSGLERLEPRIAPATLVNAHQVTFLDGDGDKITVTTTAGTFDASQFHFDSAFATSGGQVLQRLDLTNGGFSGADLTIKVQKVGNGDGKVAIGYLNAQGNDLGTVKIKGDLGRIAVGDSNTTTTALAALKTLSIGASGVSTQAAGGSTASNIQGALGKVIVKGSILNASIFVTGNADADGSIGKIQIGSLVGGDADRGEITATGNIGPVHLTGSLLGGAGNNSGRIATDGKLGAVTIDGQMIGDLGSHSGELKAVTGMGALTLRGGLTGGGGNSSGYIDSDGAIGAIKIGKKVDGTAGGGSIHSVGDMGFVRINGSLLGGDVKAVSGSIYCEGILQGVTIHGSVVGGTQGDTGEIIAGAGMPGKIKITGDVIGGTAFQTGYISVESSLKSLVIGGSLKGGGVNGDNSHGYISILNDLKFVKIGKDIVGSNITGSGSSSGTGYLQAGGKIGKAIIGGSIIAGTDESTGSLNHSGAIVAIDSIGSLVVKGDLVGNTSSGGTTTVLIGAGGHNFPTPLTIGNVKVAGSVKLTNIVAGYNLSQPMFNSSDSIGTVKVGKNWIQSNLIAGALPQGDGVYGTSDDTSGPSVIAKIVVGGHVAGTAINDNSSDHFGFVARNVKAMTIGGHAVKLTSGQDNIDLGVTSDVTIFETP